MTDYPQITFFEFKARKFCSWLDLVMDSGQYDAVRASHVVSGLVASAAKLLRIRLAGRPQQLDPVPASEPPKPASAAAFPVECRADWAEICRRRGETGGLPGCLAEVRRELRAGLDLLDSGRPYDAVSHWQLSYVHNWGELAICALMMLHTDLARTRSS